MDLLKLIADHLKQQGHRVEQSDDISIFVNFSYRTTLVYTYHSGINICVSRSLLHVSHRTENGGITTTNLDINDPDSILRLEQLAEESKSVVAFNHNQNDLAELVKP